MRIFKDTNDLRIMFIEYKDFDNVDSCVRQSRGLHAHIVFIPIAYKETYRNTELIQKLAPNFMIMGDWLSEVYFYET